MKLFRALSHVFLVAFLTGCGASSREPVRLTLISPHRDEIREEVARAFQDWFQARTEQRLTAAHDALQGWLNAPDSATLSSTRHAVDEFLRDWKVEEFPEVRVAHLAWSSDFTPVGGRRLQQALEETHTQFPRVELVWQDIGGGTSQIRKYLGSRYEANPQGIGIDVLYGGGTDIYVSFAKQGLLEKVDIPAPLLDPRRVPPQLNGVPLYDPDGLWYGPMLSSFGILYNGEVLDRIGQPRPAHVSKSNGNDGQGWAYLGRPGLCGWVSAGDPRLTGSVHMVYEIILQRHGWNNGFSLLLRMGANTHSFIRDSGTLTRMVSSGEVAAAGNLDANALSAVGRNPQTMGFHLPEGETIINPDAMAVLKGAPRYELARAFVEFNLSDEGQRLFLLRPGQPGGPRRYALCRLSIVPRLYECTDIASPFAVQTGFQYNSKQGTDRWDALNDLFGAVIVDAHADLNAAWRAVLEQPSSFRRDQLEQDLFQPLWSEADLDKHARDILEAGPRARTLTLNRWGEQARQHYRGIQRRSQL